MIKQLVKRIKAERIRQKITIEELSLKSGVSKKHISNTENAKVVPTLETLKKLAESLGFEINISLEARDSPNPKDVYGGAALHSHPIPIVYPNKNSK